MQNSPFKSMAPKMEIINLLAARRGFRRYLELCTPTTGNCYAALNRALFSTAHRLMYRCPAEFQDGLDIDFRSESPNVGQCVAEIQRRGLCYDIVLVDSWHEYKISKRDIELALALIRPGGVIVVHDCLPPSAQHAGPQYQDGCWCGVSYKAYLDVVGSRSDLDYCTVDTDYGCGVIRKLDDRQSWRRWQAALAVRYRLRRAPWKQWYEIGDDFDRAFEYMHENKEALLRLISAGEFVATLDVQPRG